MSAMLANIEDTAEIKLYTKRGITLVRGEGVFLWDSQGRRYIDAMSNYGVNVLGHRHPKVHAAIVAQLENLISCHQSFYNDARASFEQTLLGVLPPGLTRISYSNSGTEANEAALKFARLATGRQRIISAVHGYHGRTFGALSVTGVEKYREGLAPLLGECAQVAFDDLDALAGEMSGSAAVILEPIQGERGVHSPDPRYLQTVRQLCDQHGTLLILDEVQTGMGRTGKLFAFEHAGIVPDVLTISKAIANGLPMGVTVVTEELAARVPSGSHGSTFAGNPLVCAAAKATLETIATDDFLDSVRGSGTRFLDGLRAIDHPMVREVRGTGLMIAVELKKRMTPYLKALQDNGVLALPAGSKAIRFLPPLIVGAAEIDEIVETLDKALQVVS